MNHSQDMKDSEKHGHSSSAIFPLGIPSPLLLNDGTRRESPTPCSKLSNVNENSTKDNNKSKYETNRLQLLPSLPPKSFDSLATFIKIFNTKDGKDKIIKIIQYTFKLIIWADTHTRIRQVAGVRKNIKSSTKGNKTQIYLKTYAYLILLKWAKVFAPQFSTVRQFLRFGNWMEPLYALCEVCKSVKTKGLSNSFDINNYNIFQDEFLGNAIELYNAIFDDVYLCTKLGLFKKVYPNLGTFADLQANYAWMGSIVLALGKERAKLWKQQSEYLELSKQEQSILSSPSEKTSESDKDRLKQIAVGKYKVSEARKMSLYNSVKLLCDMLFCGLEIVPFGSKVNPVIPTLAGLTSAFIGYYKFYLKEHQAAYLKGL